MLGDGLEQRLICSTLGICKVECCSHTQLENALGLHQCLFLPQCNTSFRNLIKSVKLQGITKSLTVLSRPISISIQKRSLILKLIVNEEVQRCVNSSLLSEPLEYPEYPMERPSTSVTWGNYRTLPGDKQNEANETDGIFSTSFILVVTYVYVVKSTIQHYFNSSSCPTNTEICVTTDSLTLDKAKRQFFFLQDLRRMGCEPRTFNLLLQFLGCDTVTKISCWLSLTGIYYF